MTNLQLLKDILEMLSYIIVIISFPTSMYMYYSAKIKEKIDRDYGTYDALDEKYIDFQKLCLQYSYLDVFDIPDEIPSELSILQEKEQKIALTMLIAIFERAYLMYIRASSDVRNKQWTGWETYIYEYCKRKNFINLWKESGSAFDADFQNYIRETIEKVSTVTKVN